MAEITRMAVVISSATAHSCLFVFLSRLCFIAAFNVSNFFFQGYCT